MEGVGWMVGWLVVMAKAKNLSKKFQVKHWPRACVTRAFIYLASLWFFQLFLLLYISMSFAQTFVVLSFFALEKLPLWLLLKILRLFYSYFWGFLKFVTLNSLTKACSLQHKQEHFFLLTDALSNVIDPKNFCF